MYPNFPAFQLLLVLSLALVVGLPGLIWLFMRGNRDQGARLWFLAVAVHATALCLVGYLGRFSWISAVLFLWAVLLAIESMRWELGRPSANRALAAVAFVAYAALQLTLDRLGLRLSTGYVLNLLLLITTEGLLIWLLLKVSRLRDSRGLLMVALGIFLIAGINAVRLLQAIQDGGGPEAFAGTSSTNIAVVVVTLFSVLQVVGYGGFVMEKLHQRQLDHQLSEARATERRQLAERHAQDMEAVVRQRDDMIMLNSRFSSVNSMALYNSAIVHEISQPLQALLSILDGMKLRLGPEDGGQQGSGIDDAMTMVRKMSNTLGALRTLMGSQQPRLERLSVDAVLGEILPIMQTQARRQAVLLEHRNSTQPGDQVLVNRVLLQRVIFNLVTNALEALATRSPWPSQDTAAEHSPASGGRLVLSTTTEQCHGLAQCVLRIQDNGPGLPEDLPLSPGLSLHTTKEQGLGVGLSFTKMVVESWRGQLNLQNRPKEQGGGALVEVRLPLLESIEHGTPTSKSA